MAKEARVKYTKRCPQCKAHFEGVWNECTSCKLPLQPAWRVSFFEFLHSLFWGMVNCILLVVLLVVLGYGLQKEKRPNYQQAFSYLVGGDTYNLKQQLKIILPDALTDWWKQLK
ncbi:MAG TPA: hypothetical protein P5110_01750 [Candidatus Omnitrophota bacterium]|nr:hypothetical protein [Candidatus Omnitrophota bacterium]